MHSGGEYQEKIEYYIHYAHEHIQYARYIYITTATQHTAGQHIELEGRQ